MHECALERIKDDLIRRQQAISEEKMQIVINNYFKSECSVDTSIRQAFEKGFRIGVKKGLTVQPEPQWISCEERFPEPDENVLVTIGYGCYVWSRTSNHGDNYFWEDENGFYHEKDEVDAWMPLPTYEGMKE